jgi:hypothetical protein
MEADKCGQFTLEEILNVDQLGYVHVEKYIKIDIKQGVRKWIVSGLGPVGCCSERMKAPS